MENINKPICKIQLDYPESINSSQPQHNGKSELKLPKQGKTWFNIAGNIAGNISSNIAGNISSNIAGNNAGNIASNSAE